jgi:hypothetical protein
VQLARAAYAAALAAARERSTPATWRRLLRAGWNLRDALAVARARRAPRGWPPRSHPSTAPEGGS